MKAEDLEKYFRDQLEDDQSFDLDADSVWHSLSPKLKQKKRRRGIIYIFSLIGLLLTMAYFVFGAKEESTMPLVNSNEKSELEIQEASSLNKEKNIIQAKNKKEENAFTIESKELNIRYKEKVILPGSLQTQTQTQTQTQSQTALLEPTHENATSSLIDGLTINVLDNQNEESQIILPVLSGLPLPFVITYQEPKINLPFSDPIVDSQNNSSSILLGLESGLLYSNAGIKANGTTEYARLRKDSETPQLGWQVELNALRLNKSGIVYGLGLGYQKSWTKLSHQWQYEEDVVLADVPLHILIDLATMDTMGIQVGNAIVRQTRNREVQHYNEFQTISLPVHIGFIKEKPRLTYGVLGGISFQYRLKQKGRLFDENASLIDFNNDSYFKQFGFSAHLKPTLSLSIGSDYLLSLNPAISFSLTNQIKENIGIFQRPINYSLSIGLMKEINK